MRVNTRVAGERGTFASFESVLFFAKVNTFQNFNIGAHLLPPQVGGANHSHATQDLWEAIAAGDYPEWQLCIQVRPAALFTLQEPPLLSALLRLC